MAVGLGQKAGRYLLALLVVLAFGVGLFVFAYGSDADGQLSHTLAGPVGVLPQGKGVALVPLIATFAPCEPLYRGGISYLPNCTLQILVDRFGPPDKVYSSYGPVNDPYLYYVTFLYLDEGLKCSIDPRHWLTPIQDTAVSTCDRFEPTDWEHYEAEVGLAASSFRNWRGFADLSR